jgi:hypothetical protein
MTKQNPDILCKSCKEFDQSFENGMARCDFLVTCDHDEKHVGCFSTAQTLTISWNWVSVKETLPKDGVEVLITDGKRISLGHVNIHPYGGPSDWYDEDGRTQKVTHWMCLPTLPEY